MNTLVLSFWPTSALIFPALLGVDMVSMQVLAVPQPREHLELSVFLIFTVSVDILFHYGFNLHFPNALSTFSFVYWLFSIFFCKIPFKGFIHFYGTPFPKGS